MFLALTTVAGCNCSEEPAPILHVSPGTSVHVGQVVTFDANRQKDEPDDGISDNTNFAWDLNGDGRYEERPGERVVDQSFNTPGRYRVGVVASNLIYTGWLDSSPFFVHGYVSQVITVTAPSGPQPPAASFTFSPSPGYTESPITFDASGSTDADGQVVKYEWDWTADGTYDESGTAASTSHAYEFPGTYTARLRVTDNDGSTGTTDRTVQVMDGVPPAKVIAGEAGGLTAARAGSPFSLELGHASFHPGITTVAGTKLLTAGIRAGGRLSFKRAPALLGTHRSSRWATSLALVQKGNGSSAKLSGQGYILLALSKGNSLCLAGTAAGKLGGGGFTGRLAVAGGSGPSARLRGAGTFSPALHILSKPTLSGRLKLRRVHKKRALPKVCRTLVHTLGH